ncbi:DPP IV N-terminal domain-containing protein [Thermomonas sp. S9]|uniref:DPP IV N-terminal domain-containing protein n=1 Tax=Thermomonas sp. S9 TaxID=2885203 RepID=UPI00216AE9BC|nr:DPP IV N-terminal domain-containing protein [Thermomonas sp. S9]MCR6495259.1 DPP IV N-terminal domain-containing protein [Thermomonas sp. S9]
MERHPHPAPDPATRTLLVTGVGREAGRDPYYVHVYAVGMDDGSVRLLTPENANHTATVSADGKYFLDLHSTIDSAPVAVVRDAAGKQVAELARAGLARLKAAGWAATGVHGEGARRQDRSLRPAVQAVALRPEQEVPDHHLHLPGPAGRLGAQPQLPARAW